MKQRTLQHQVAKAQDAELHQARLFGQACAQLPLRGRLRVALLIVCNGNAHAEVLLSAGLVALAALAVIGFVASAIFLGRGA